MQLLWVLIGTHAIELRAGERSRNDLLRFGRTTSHITLDGKLTESAWAEAPSTTRFYEIFPAERGVPPVSTEARFLMDEKYVYVAVRAFDPNVTALRAPLVRRDHVLSDQDYVEIMLDPQDTRRSAMLFRVNARGVQTDGIFTEDTQLRDYAPDFNFDSATSHDATGWSVELRIPLSTLRFPQQQDHAWAVLLFRNWPRDKVVTLASAAIPYASACTLCFADQLSGAVRASSSVPLFVTPQATYSKLESHDQVRLGADVKWQPRPDTSVDLTVNPDFSQVEADDLQLSANARFALAVTEKRPFFLESADLLTTPINAVYTRAFSDPEAGARFTRRGDQSEYTSMVVRDAGGGVVLEPGPQFSQSGLQDFASTAVVTRYRRTNSAAASFGMLGSGRWNDDGSSNVVVGADGYWAPGPRDRIGAQLLWSETHNPNRPDLLAAWQGDDRSGLAAATTWQHTDAAWFSSLSYTAYAHGFRSWNGFIPQVGIATPVLNTGLYFRPENSWLIRVSPQIMFSEVSEIGGGRLSRSYGPGVELDAARDTTLTLFWYPRAMDTGIAGPRNFNFYSLTLLTSPFAWMPQASLIGEFGQALDLTTGEVAASQRWQAFLPVRILDRLELGFLGAYQRLDSRTRSEGARPLLTETDLQLSAIWHFSSRLYAYGLYQTERTQQAMSPLANDDASSRTQRFSLLLSYEANWQTRYYVGLRSGDEGHEIFGKISYAFSR
jgi:hypothetical protein